MSGKRRDEVDSTWWPLMEKEREAVCETGRN